MNLVAPSTRQLLEATERAWSQNPVYRPLTALAVLTGRDRSEIGRLSVGQRDELVLQIRAMLFGSHISALARCPSCTESVELEFETTDVTQPTMVDGPVHMVHDGIEIAVRPLDAADIETSSPDPMALAKRCIDESAGITMTPELATAIGKTLADVDPNAMILLALTCPSCQAEFDQRFDPWAYLWEELQIIANRTLHHIHKLAAAYGWTEQEILALSPYRRTQYLKFLGG